MEEATKALRSKKDTFILVLILILLAAGVVANSYFVELTGALRFALWLVLSGVIVGLAALTGWGKRIWIFTQEARVELYKVIWPTRDETVKTTAIVAVLVCVMSIILWILDSSLLWVVSWITR